MTLNKLDKNSLISSCIFFQQTFSIQEFFFKTFEFNSSLKLIMSIYYNRFSAPIDLMAYGFLRGRPLAWELKTFLSLNKPIKGCDVDTLGRRIFNFGRPSYEIAHTMHCKINGINSTLARGKYPEGTVCDNLKPRDLEKILTPTLSGIDTVYAVGVADWKLLSYQRSRKIIF